MDVGTLLLHIDPKLSNEEAVDEFEVEVNLLWGMDIYSIDDVSIDYINQKVVLHCTNSVKDNPT